MHFSLSHVNRLDQTQSAIAPEKLPFFQISVKTKPFKPAQMEKLQIAIMCKSSLNFDLRRTARTDTN
jgi:hypothetical protein